MMSQFEKFINDYEGAYSSEDIKRGEILLGLHPFVKMALCHYIFETIHPFNDGNGRIGRVLNILYLMSQGTIDSPLLYLSGYILDHKRDYHDLLSGLNANKNLWEEWILFIITGIKETSQKANKFIDRFINLKKRNFISMSNIYLSQTFHKEINTGPERRKSVKELNPKKAHEFYKLKRLLNFIYSNPYTTTNRIMRYLSVSRSTSLKYTESLTKWGHLTVKKIGNKHIYKNIKLGELLGSDLIKILKL